MPAAILQARLSVGPLAPAGVVTVSHGLALEGLGLVPTRADPDRATPIVVTAVTATQISFRNDGIAVASSDFVIQFDHTIQQAADPIIQEYWQGLDAGANAAYQTELVFQPGGVASAGVYTDFGLLYADLAALGWDIPKTIIFDNTFISPCVVPAGAYVMTNVVWKGLYGDWNVSVVQIANGASFTDLLTFDHIYVDNRATTSPVALAAGDLISLFFQSDIYQGSVGAAPMFTGIAVGPGGYATVALHNESSFGLNIPGRAVITMPTAGAVLDIDIGEQCRIAYDTVDCAVGTVTRLRPVSTSARIYPQAGILGTLQQNNEAYPRYTIKPARGVVPSTINILGVRPGDWIRLNATAGVFGQTMPQISNATWQLVDSQPVIITETSGLYGITVNRFDVGETIDGAASFDLPPGGTVAFIPDGVSNWTTYGISIDALLNRHNTFTQAQGSAQVTLTDEANIATDAALSNSFIVTLEGNRTLDNPTHLVAGFTYQWTVVQDGTGNRTLAYGALFKWPGGVAPVLSVAAAARDVITAAYDGTQLNAVFQAAFS